jgi:mediator of RNA polymerase II transcription subunit 18, fungi type
VGRPDVIPFADEFTVADKVQFDRFVSEYYTEGHRFVHENVVLYLHQILHEPGVRSLETSPKPVPPAFDQLKPLDPSGAYILEAKIRVQDLNNTVVSEKAVAEMNKFRASMKGCVEMSAPERLWLDTRVKHKPKPLPQTMVAS